MYGDDKFHAVELKYGNTSKLKGFLMFSLYWCDEDHLQRILGFGLHSLIKLLRYRRLFLHMNATFDGAPRGFYQVLIFSVMDHASGMHTPISYCPMTENQRKHTTCCGRILWLLWVRIQILCLYTFFYNLLIFAFFLSLWYYNFGQQEGKEWMSTGWCVILNGQWLIR